MRGWKRLWITIVCASFIGSIYYTYHYEYRDDILRCVNEDNAKERLRENEKYVNYVPTQEEKKKFKAIKFVEKYKRKKMSQAERRALPENGFIFQLGVNAKDPFWLQALTVQYNLKNNNLYKYEYDTWKFCAKQSVYASYGYIFLTSFFIAFIVGLLLLVSFKLINWILSGFKE